MNQRQSQQHKEVDVCLSTMRQWGEQGIETNALSDWVTMVTLATSKQHIAFLCFLLSLLQNQIHPHSGGASCCFHVHIRQAVCVCGQGFAFVMKM